MADAPSPAWATRKANESLIPKLERAIRKEVAHNWGILRLNTLLQLTTTWLRHLWLLFLKVSVALLILTVVCFRRHVGNQGSGGSFLIATLLRGIFVAKRKKFATEINLKAPPKQENAIPMERTTSKQDKPSTSHEKRSRRQTIIRYHTGSARRMGVDARSRHVSYFLTR